jgi:lysophospholipase L1-like esterase
VPDVSTRPGSPGFFRGLPLPGRREALVIGIILSIAAIVVGAAAWYANHRTVPVFTPPSVGESGSPPPSPAHAPVLAFYGDNYVTGTAQGGIDGAGWPAIVSGRLGATPTPVHAVAGAGYVAAGPSTSETYPDLARKGPEPQADVTIVFGTRNDFAAAPADIYAAAMQTFATIRSTAPGTRLLVIGPAWTDAAVPPELPRVRDAVQRAAADSGATFVDPLADRWFFGNPELIGRDVVNPTDAGHVYLADHIEPELRRVLAELPDVRQSTASATPSG